MRGHSYRSELLLVTCVPGVTALAGTLFGAGLIWNHVLFASSANGSGLACGASIVVTGIVYLVFLRSKLLQALRNPDVFTGSAWKRYSFRMLVSFLALLLLFVLFMDIWIFASVLA